MAQTPSFQEPSGNGPKTYLLIAFGLLAFLGLAWFVYTSWNSVTSVAVEETPPTVVDMLPPPPPPPPPPPEPQEKPPEPTEKPTPTPEPTPAPTPDKPAPAPMQIDGPAQAGTDAFGMSAGKGGGMGTPGSTGSCVGPNCGAPPPAAVAPKMVAGTDKFWGRGIASMLEDHIERSKKVNVDAYLAEFNIWVSPAGELTRAQMLNGSGNGKVDQTVLALLQTARGLKPPPSSIQMPQRIKVGRKRF
jgi:periplasmic protein TonB